MKRQKRRKKKSYALCLSSVVSLQEQQDCLFQGHGSSKLPLNFSYRFFLISTAKVALVVKIIYALNKTLILMPNMNLWSDFQNAEEVFPSQWLNFTCNFCTWLKSSLHNISWKHMLQFAVEILRYSETQKKVHKNMGQYMR